MVALAPHARLTRAMGYDAVTMGLLSSLLIRKNIIRRIVVERLTEPLHLNLLSLPISLFGSTRAKIAFDLLVRQQHAYGLLDAADAARARVF